MVGLGMSLFRRAAIVGALIAGASCSVTPPRPLVTHAPKTAANVWRLALKNESWGSAVPVAMWDRDTILFLSVAHLARMARPADAIMEDRTKLRKLRIIKIVLHPRADLAVVHAKSDGAEVAMVPINMVKDPVPGLSVFSAGFPGPLEHWGVHRGYVGTWPWTTCYIERGMSGGALLLHNGDLIAVLRGHSYDTEWLPVCTDEEGLIEPTGEEVMWQDHRPFDSIVVPLKPHKTWLEKQKVL